MNTGRSRNQEISTPFVGALEARNEVVLAEILQKLLPHSKLKVFEGAGTLTDEILNVSGDINPANVALAALRRDTRLIQPPLCDQPIGLNRRGKPVQFDFIAPHDDAEFFQIQVCILRLQRIEGPLDQMNASLQS